MIHNSYDFSMSETATKIDQDQNPSWINLRSLKDCIRMSSDRAMRPASISGEGKRKTPTDRQAPTMNLSNDQDEQQISSSSNSIINHIDTPMGSAPLQEIESIIDDRSKHGEDQASQVVAPATAEASTGNGNQFKRKKRQVVASQYSLPEAAPSKATENTDSTPYQELKEKPVVSYNHSQKNSCQLFYNSRKDGSEQGLQEQSLVFNSKPVCYDSVTSSVSKLQFKKQQAQTQIKILASGDKKKLDMSATVDIDLQSSENKENQNPYQSRKRSSQVLYDEAYMSQTSAIGGADPVFGGGIRIVDTEMNQFCERVEKIKSKLNPLTQRDTNLMFRLSCLTASQKKKSKSTPLKSQTHSLDLSRSCSNQSSLQSTLKKCSNSKILDTDDENLKNSQVIQQPAKHASFKRQAKSRQPSFEFKNQSQKPKIVQEVSLQQQEQKQSILVYKKENGKLRRQLEEVSKQHQAEITNLKTHYESLLFAQMKSREEEHSIIVEGLKQDYEDRIQSLEKQLLKQAKELANEQNQKVVEYETKLEKKRAKNRQIKELMGHEIQELRRQVEAYQNQLNEMQTAQLTDNVFHSNSNSQHKKYEEIIRRNQSKKACISCHAKSESVPHLGQGDSDSDDDVQEGTPYQSLDNFVISKQKQLFSQDISNIGMHSQHQQPSQHQNYFSLSQHQDESAMNFSFSDVKTSVDKSVLFDRNLMVLYTEHQMNILEKISQEEAEDEDHLGSFRRRSQVGGKHRHQFDQPIHCDGSSSNDEEEEFNSQYYASNGDRHHQQNERKSKMQRQRSSSSDGSENAPEDSGFVSDDQDYQERIVNESSLEVDDMLIMTGRSESAIDEDDDISCLSKCKAINSSYINLKRNNLLISYGKK